MDLPYFTDVFVTFIVINIVLHFIIFLFDKLLPSVKIIWNFLGWVASCLWFVFYYNANFSTYWDFKVQMYVVIASVVYLAHWLFDSDAMEGWKFTEYKFRNFLSIIFLNSLLLGGWYYALWI